MELGRLDIFTGMATGFPAFFYSYGSYHFSPKGEAGNPNCLSFRCTEDHWECGHLCGTARIAFPLSVISGARVFVSEYDLGFV